MNFYQLSSEKNRPEELRGVNFYQLSSGKIRPEELQDKPPIIFYGFQEPLWGGPAIETFTTCSGLMHIHIREGLVGGSYHRHHEWGGNCAHLGHYRLALSLCIDTLNNGVEDSETIRKNEARALAVYEQIAEGPIVALPENWELDDAYVYRLILAAEQEVVA